MKSARVASLLLPVFVLAGCGIGIATDDDEATCQAAAELLSPVHDGFTMFDPDYLGTLQAAATAAADWYPDDNDLAGGVHALRRALDQVIADGGELTLDNRIQLGDGLIRVSNRCEDYGLGW